MQPDGPGRGLCEEAPGRLIAKNRVPLCSGRL